MGAKILCKSNTELCVGEGAVVAANTVVLRSIPPYEVWGYLLKRWGDKT